MPFLSLLLLLVLPMNSGLVHVNSSITIAQAAGTDCSARVIFSDSETLVLETVGNGRVIVAGELIDTNVTGFSLGVASNKITNTGADAGATPAVLTLHYLYISNAKATFAPLELRLSASSPELVDSIQYLKATGNGSNWRFLARVWVGDAGAGVGLFFDDEQLRGIGNYYNRQAKRVVTCPAYVDNNAATTFAVNQAAFAAINGGTGDSIVFLSNGEDTIHVSAHVSFSAVGASAAFVGIGVNSTTSPATSAQCKVVDQSTTVDLATTPAAGKVTISLLCCTQATAYTARADNARLGAAADPYVTFLEAIVWI